METVVRNNAAASWSFSQDTTACSGDALIISDTTFVSTTIMAEGRELLEVQRFVRLAGRQIQVRTPGGAKDLQEQIAQPLRRCDGSLQDLADLLFHGNALPGRAIPEPIVGLVVKFADAQAGQGAPPRDQCQHHASTCWHPELCFGKSEGKKKRS